MAEEPNGAAERIRDALAYVCRQLDVLSAVLPENDEASPLRRLLEAMRNGEDPDRPLQALHTALLAAGDHIGVYGNRGIRPVGVDDGAEETVYLCPAHRCSRYSWPAATVDPPQCAITEQPLRRDGL
ncbi:hypothetical protein [Streptomyces sp. NPDC002133]|uniref:hypothetical protein n=1 Tax=Streptomyces sp. NPDC002133 TaxID=3154409 RepID=UPI00332B6993